MNERTNVCVYICILSFQGKAQIPIKLRFFLNCPVRFQSLIPTHSIFGAIYTYNIYMLSSDMLRKQWLIIIISENNITLELK